MLTLPLKHAVLLWCCRGGKLLSQISYSIITDHPISHAHSAKASMKKTLRLCTSLLCLPTLPYNGLQLHRASGQWCFYSTPLLYTLYLHKEEKVSFLLHCSYYSVAVTSVHRVDSSWTSGGRGVCIPPEVTGWHEKGSHLDSWSGSHKHSEVHTAFLMVHHPSGLSFVFCFSNLLKESLTHSTTLSQQLPHSPRSRVQSFKLPELPPAKHK